MPNRSFVKDFLNRIWTYLTKGHFFNKATKSVVLIFSIILLRRLRGKPISPSEKLGLLLASIGLLYGMLSYFGSAPPAEYAGLLIAITILSAILITMWIFWIPMKIRLRSTKFEAEILNARESYRLGEEIRFRTFYRGQLINGFYDNEIFPPTGKHFPPSMSPGKSGTVWSWDTRTLADGIPNTAGKLNGYLEKEFRWNWPIPIDAPTGDYRVFMRVYNHLGIGQRPIQEQEETSFVVSDA